MQKRVTIVDTFKVNKETPAGAGERWESAVGPPASQTGRIGSATHPVPSLHAKASVGSRAAKTPQGPSLG